MFSKRGMIVAGLGLLFGLSAQATSIDSTVSIPDCNLGGCTWSMTVDNVPIASGSYNINQQTGAISLPEPVLIYGVDDPNLADDVYVGLMNIYGNADPILGFSVAAGAGASGNTFAFNFSLPIALSGLINANSSVSYSLTSLTAAGAQIAPLFGNVVVAQEADTTPFGLPALNKGVDVGNTFAFLGGPQTQNSPVYTASNQFVGNLAYDRMSATIAFSLSPNSNVGLSGFVQQQLAPVPVPAAVWLLGSALGLLGWIRRARA